MRWIKGTAFAAAIACAGAAWAEAVRIEALVPPRARAVALAQSLAIGRIGGRDGMQFGIALERELARAGVGGRPWFDVLAGRAGAERADMIVDGVVATDAVEGRVRLKRNRCVEGPEDKCVKRGEVELDCTRRTIDIAADLRIAGGEDGRVAYSERKTRRDEVNWCPGDTRPRGTEEAVGALLASLAGEVAGDLAPRSAIGNIRFREGRKGMDKASGERFKAAIRLTQRDLPAACAEFAALPPHPSNAFNLALCTEARDDYAAAEAGFAELARTDRSGDVREAIDRVRGTIEVRRLIAERQGG